MPDRTLALTTSGVDEDPERPVRILAHAIARTADRFPLLRKMSRHMEGVEKRSGIMSDLIAEGIALYDRNTEEIDRLVGQYVGSIRQTAQQRQAARKAASTNGGTTHAPR